MEKTKYSPRQRALWFKENKDRETFQAWLNKTGDLFTAAFYVFPDSTDLSEQQCPWSRWRG